MIILLGATGYVGSAFLRHLTASRTEVMAVSRSEVDYYDPKALCDLMRQSQASFLINCAGYTGKPNVDACERDKTECLHGNAILPGRIRAACETLGIPWGHVSSGCIFTGSRPDGKGFGEVDQPNFSFRTNNCSFYSGTKALGEEILDGDSQSYIWRLRIPFNHVDSPRNYLSKLLSYRRLLEATNSLSHLDEFVNACLQCWTRSVPYGIYNVVNTGSITTRRVTEILREHLVPEREFDFFDTEAEFMRTAAITPRSNCELDNSKLLSTGIVMSHVEDAIRESLRNWSSRQANSKLSGTDCRG